MQLSLRQSELEIAVRQYVAKQGLNLAGKDVKVLFSATRGEDGIKATIDIDELGDQAEQVTIQRPVLVSAPTPVLHAVAEAPGPIFTADAPFATEGEVVVEETKPAKSSLFG